MKPILQLQRLNVALPPGADRTHAIRDLDLSLSPNEILCVVGESGSGKSMTAGAIMGLLPSGVRADSGSVLFDGQDLLALSEAEMRKVRGAKIAMVFQEPMTALNPLRTVGDQIGEMFRVHTTLDAREIKARVIALLTEVHIPDPEASARAFPHELSGGQRQRAMIAMALALEPRVLIADEPTTALDVTTQAQILVLIRDLQKRKGTAVLFITHDFGVVAEIADRVAVMQNGVLVEHGPAAQILNSPQHPYTRKLIAAVPALTPPPARALGTEPALVVDKLTMVYRTGGGFFGRGKRVTKALDDVSLVLPKGATLGVVGESGSGKSTLARCIVRLLDPESGTIRIGDVDLASMSRRELRQATRRVQMVFQDPYASLNPRRRAGDLVAQGPIAHGVSRADARKKAQSLFALVGLDPAAIDRYPHEFSGGQRQRIGLARALALDPEILVADEPVSALDVSVQAQVLDLLADLKVRLGLSMVFVTHDLRVAAQICDQVAVMHKGRIVETGPADRVFTDPQHAYTRQLIEAIPGRSWSSRDTLMPLAA
ncbi:ABC transporter ATP-binding protein [Variovorax sp. PAMC 28711]|uniref:ABC transporter ATP-binding protein n=1 Tax=Variovorax sp. PAMC 28711 TaxID=1795631 RepID=UPI00078D4C6D|nr:ABC transporter ATP-binding protein [Variovorax sp. PAMC 28711]AMM23218.1 microcin ABC transporter ATP-binding protein [Variovorax sp. PAMC 28711]